MIVDPFEELEGVMFVSMLEYKLSAKSLIDWPPELREMAPERVYGSREKKVRIGSSAISWL